MPGRLPDIQIQTLGEVQVRRGTELLDLGPAKQRAVFAALALSPGETVTTTALREAVWGADQPKSARQVLHTYIARLRQILEPQLPPHERVQVISSTSAGYRLAVDAEHVDVARFHTVYAQARRARAEQDAVGAFQLLGAALAEWRDPDLAELSALLQSTDAIDALHRTWCEAALEYVTLGLELGHAVNVIAVAQQLATAEPLDEEAQARYVAALGQGGRRATAIAHFHQVQARLSEELGVEPGAELTRAYQQVARRPEPSDPQPSATQPPTRPPWRGPGPGIGGLIGREADLAGVTGKLTRHRLLTVVGPPGSGKSALAQQAAVHMLGRFSDGVAVVETSELTGHRELSLGLARVTGRQVDDDAGAMVGDKHLLVLLDNVEHLVGPCARMVDEVLRTFRRVSMLVTTRERLGLPYETLWPVHPLAVGAPGEGESPVHAPAVRLFAQRAMQVSLDFQLTPENAYTVASICSRLDGLPLAIELAAACMATDTLDELKVRVARPLREINPPRRYPPAHQHSLWSTLQRSVDCLNATERRCFSRLAHLRSIFGQEDAARAWSQQSGPQIEVRAVLDRLVDASLLNVIHTPAGPMYGMLRLVRCLAQELADLEPP